MRIVLTCVPYSCWKGCTSCPATQKTLLHIINHHLSRLDKFGGLGGGGIGYTAKLLGKCVNSAHACPILIIGGEYKLPNNVKTICTSTKAPPLEIGHMWGSGGGAHRMHSKVLTTFLNGSPPAPHVYPSTSFGELEEVKIVFMSLKSVFNTPE